MNNLVIFRGLILIIGGLTLFFGISYLIYVIFNKFGKRKTRKIVGSGFFSISILFTAYVISGFPFLFFENYLFFNSSAKKELKQMDLVLYDDFKILENEIGGFTSYNHIFKLKISEKDTQRLVKNKVINANNRVMVRFKVLNSYAWKKVS